MRKIPHGQAVFVFISVICLKSCEGQDVLKVACHHCDPSKKNTDTFISDVWADHLCKHTAKTLTAMVNSSCQHAQILRKHIGSDDKMKAMIRADFEVLFMFSTA